MSKLTDIRQKILQLDGGAFQELCDAYLSKSGYENILSLGTKSGTTKTTKGIPDTYFFNSREKYIFVMYTTQQSGLYKKIYEDICDCLNPTKTGMSPSSIDEIIYCHTSSNLSAGEDKELRDFLSSQGILLSLKGIDELASQIYNHYHSIAHDFLEIPISTGQIFDINEFISNHDANGMVAPLSTIFQYREEEITNVLTKIENTSVTILTGSAGVGKTRLALECCKKYADEKGFKLLCFQSNRLPIYEDLKFFLDTPNKYILFIDDANQLSGLQHVLRYLTKYKQGYNVKIVITVRDYAKQTTIEDVREFTLPEVCTIDSFTDEEIRELLKVSLNIHNSRYLDKIVWIAQGNARHAIMAGKIAVAKQSLGSISDSTQLYESYYGKLIKNNMLDQNRDLWVVAGIIAFLTALNLEKLEYLTAVLKNVGISENLFKKYAHQLHELELVDIHNDKAVKISDQSFGNYLLSYVFVEKRIIPLSVMLRDCFKNYKTHVINAFNTLANIFASKKMHEQLEKEVGIVWDEFQSTKNPLFFDFIKVFHVIRPTDTLLILQEKIDALPQENFDIYSIDFEKEKRHQSVNDDILALIGGFRDKEELQVALDLLFVYYKKQPVKFMDIYHAIISFFNIDKYSQHYDYCAQIQLIDKFNEHSNHWEDENLRFLFVKIAGELLKLSFSPMEVGRGNKVTMYQIPVELSNGSKQYREGIWESLFELYQDKKNQHEIENLIKGYGGYGGNRDEENPKLVEFDYQYIRKFFDNLFSPSQLLHCIIAKATSDSLKFYDIDVKEQLSSYLKSPDYLIYRILKGERHLEKFDWQKEKELKKKDIKDLLMDCNHEKVLHIFQVCQSIQEYDISQTWEIQDGLQLVFNNLSKNKELFLDAVEGYLNLNTPINIYPNLIVSKLFELVGVQRTDEIITKYEYNQKNAWQFSFYENLPSEFISEQHVQNLYDFLSLKDDDIILSSNIRDIKFLEKYKPFDSNVFINACRIISNKYDYSPFIFHIYFGLMFNSPTVIEHFNNDLDLLKDIYFKMIFYDKNEDHDGAFLKSFIRKDPSFIHEYVEFILRDKKNRTPRDEGRLSVIWDCINYIDLADRAFNAYINHEEETFPRDVAHCITEMFILPNESEIRINRQDKWLSHFIDHNRDNFELMKLIFSSISELPADRRKKHIIYLTKVNPDPILFEGLQLEPNHWGGWGSMIPYMEERINFLESLLPVFTGLIYIRHKKRVQDEINIWKRRIEQEEIREILEDR